MKNGGMEEFLRALLKIKFYYSGALHLAFNVSIITTIIALIYGFL
jgi:hypothetical protein